MGEQQGEIKRTTQDTIRKIRCISLVNGLTKGWQRWAKEHSGKQAAAPSGWTPEEPHDDVSTVRDQQLVSDTSEAPDVHVEDMMSEQCSIIRCSTNSIKVQAANVAVKSRDRDVVGFLASRFEQSEDLGETESPVKDRLSLLTSNQSPTRRRRCSGIVSELARGWKEMETDEWDSGVGSLDSIHQDSLDVDGEDPAAQEKNIDNMEDKSENATRDWKIKVSEPAVFIKRPSLQAGHAWKSRRPHCSHVGGLKNIWQKRSNEHTDSQKLNPFSKDFDYDYAMSTRLQKGQEGYGSPAEGTMTAERGKRASRHIKREMEDLCLIIASMGERGPNNTVEITFGRLFERYVRISDKVVGILLRARKHGMVGFEGEMLWQGRDDDTMITLIQ
uniref:actin-binding Rho-activating protein n=1 Tax=Myxine glutinosa TaxID=7769 RepID=UPI00358F8377